MSELLGIVRFKFHEGKVEEFKRLSARAMEIVRAQDTGTLQYDTYFNADESEKMTGDEPQLFRLYRSMEVTPAGTNTHGASPPSR